MEKAAEQRQGHTTSTSTEDEVHKQNRSDHIHDLHIHTWYTFMFQNYTQSIYVYRLNIWTHPDQRKEETLTKSVVDFITIKNKMLKLRKTF